MQDKCHTSSRDYHLSLDKSIWMDGGMLSILLEAGASVSVSSSDLPLMRGSMRSRNTLPKNECANTSVAKTITNFMLNS